ncbi:tautomerase family protein [Mesobacillus foraminis]|nr:tautomerase family protein [Mesobacillus foraminis]
MKKICPDQGYLYKSSFPSILAHRRQLCPEDKRFHRFISIEKEDFYYASGRTDAYTIIEVSMFEGRSAEVKKQLIRLLFEHIQDKLSISSEDVEITIFETPMHNRGIREVPGDELALHYKVDV